VQQIFSRALAAAAAFTGLQIHPLSSLQAKCDQDIPLIQQMFRVKSKTTLAVGNKPFPPGFDSFVMKIFRFYPNT